MHSSIATYSHPREEFPIPPSARLLLSCSPHLCEPRPARMQRRCALHFGALGLRLFARPRPYFRNPRRRVRASSTVCAALRPSTPKPCSCFTCTHVPAVHRPSCSQMTSQGCRRPAFRPPRGDRGGADAPYSTSSSCRRPSTCRAHAFKLATAGRCRPRCRPSRVPLHRRRRCSRLRGTTYGNPTAVAAAPTHPIPSRAPAVDLRAAAPTPSSPPPPAAVDPNAGHVGCRSTPPG